MTDLCLGLSSEYGKESWSLGRIEELFYQVRTTHELPSKVLKRGCICIYIYIYICMGDCIGEYYRAHGGISP